MFRTEIEPINLPFDIDHTNQLVLLGSCFSENIGQRLHSSKFKTQINPFGTLFHPHSIFNLLHKESLNPDLILERDEQFISHELHSSIKSDSAEELIFLFKELKNGLNHQLKKTSVLVLTFGTAFQYELKSNGEPVANCHKVPQSHFNRRLTSAEEIVDAYNGLYTQLKTQNPKLRTLLTVSPVRHTKDTLTLNNVSKSILRMACHQLQESHKDVYYFLSYEIMMDDLRDYRFYEKDLIHPNDQAIEYIWQKFGEAFFNGETQILNERITKAQRAIAHTAFNPSSEAHQQFLKRTLVDLKALNEQVPFQQEIDRIESQINE